MSHTFTHHVDRDPTLAVTYLDGDVQIIGLRQLLVHAHLIADLSGLTPPGYAGWRRLLAVLAYRTSGLDATVSVTDWRRSRDEVWTRGCFDPTEVDAYFDQWGHRLDLFDTERPWLQVPEIATQAVSKPLSTILTDRPTGANAATLFSPFHDAINATTEVHKAIEAMLMVYGYAGGGRMGARTLPGGESQGHGYGAPLRARISHLPLGPSLFHTLVASLVAPVSVPLRDPDAPDLAEWERDPADPTGSRPAATGIVSLFSGQAQHAILLVPTEIDGRTVVEKVHSTWRYQKNEGPDQAGSDPYLAYQTKVEMGVARPVPKMSVLGFPIRDAWRSLPSLIPTASGGVDPVHKSPVIVSELATLPADDDSWMKVTVCAWSQEPGQQRDGDWDRSDTPDIHVALWTTADVYDPQPQKWRSGIDSWVHACEDEFALLQQRLRRARREAFELDAKKDKASINLWAERVVNDYWADAYELFTHALVSAVNAEVYVADAGRARDKVRRITRRLYEQATDGQITSRTAKHIIRNRPSLVALSDSDTKTADTDEEQAAS